MLLDAQQTKETLKQAEQENYFLKGLRDQRDREIIDLKVKLEALEQEKNRSLETLQLKHTYDNDKLRRQVDDMKRSLVKFHNVHARASSLMQASVSEKRVITEAELEEVQTSLRAQEAIVNQLLIGHV